MYLGVLEIRNLEWYSRTYTNLSIPSLFSIKFHQGPCFHVSSFDDSHDLEILYIKTLVLTLHGIVLIAVGRKASWDCGVG